MRDLIPYCRWTVFSFFIALMLFGPFYRQVFDGKSHYFRNWVMFHGYAAGKLYETRFVSVKDGKMTAIDRFRVLGT